MNYLFEGKGQADDVIAIIGTETIFRGPLRRLRPGVWLNDELVNFQMHVMNLLHLDGLKCYCFNSFFNVQFSRRVRRL